MTAKADFKYGFWLGLGFATAALALSLFLGQGYRLN